LVCLLLLAVAVPLVGSGSASAEFPWPSWWPCHKRPCAPVCEPGDPGGTWVLLQSPEQARRATISQFNRYCVRCHGIDGRGVWDIPDVPDFTNTVWQSCRSDAQLARLIWEGRGAVMPPFRGTLTLEESWAMARYLRTFLPGSEAPRPDLGTEAGKQAPSADRPPVPKP
jgi:mono/diheme cytochrome c family protein